MGLVTDLLTGKLFRFKTANGAEVNTGTSDKVLCTPYSIGNSSVCFREAGSANAGDPIVVGTGNKLMKSETRGTAFNKNFGTTAGSIMEGNELVGFTHFVVTSQINLSASTFQPGSAYEIIPTNAYGYNGRAANYSATFFAYVQADSGAVGEVALYDVEASGIVAGSVISFDNPTFQIKSSAAFTLTPGKVYTYAIRKVSGGGLTVVSLRSAMMTFKLPKA